MYDLPFCGFNFLILKNVKAKGFSFICMAVPINVNKAQVGVPQGKQKYLQQSFEQQS